MEVRLNKQQLWDALGMWNTFLKRKVHLIACGGTAMTLMDIKESTRDIDFIVPNIKEYNYLIETIQQLGYKSNNSLGWVRQGELFKFDLFPGKKIHVTELIDDPLDKDKHTLLKELSHVYVGVLNDYDLIVSKLLRGDLVDFQDCVQLFLAHENVIDLKKLENHFNEMVSYSVGDNRIRGNWKSFLSKLNEV